MRVRPVVALSAAILVGLAALGLLAWRAPSAPPRLDAPQVMDPIPVDALRQRPERFTGEIRVSGIVGDTKDSEGLFSLIDKREVEECGSTTCADFLLPVQWHGAMPGEGSEVTVTGAVQRSASGLVFAATRLVTP